MENSTAIKANTFIETWQHVKPVSFYLYELREGAKLIMGLELGNSKECSDYCTIACISHTSKVMLKIPQARLQQYMNREFPDVQAGYRKGRGTRDQIANVYWIIEKAREFQKNIYLCFIDNAKAFVWDGDTRPSYLSPEKSVCRSRSNS